VKEALARIQVKETEGIRRFLYPIHLPFLLPSHLERAPLHLTNPAGQTIPAYISKAFGEMRLEFPVFLAPYETGEYLLIHGSASAPLEDPLTLITRTAGGLRSEQQRVAFDLSERASVDQVTYDGVAHLRQPMQIRRLNSSDWILHSSNYAGNPLNGWIEAAGDYSDGSAVRTRTEITACKSWAHHSLRLDHPQEAEILQFICDFNGGDSPLIFDTGLGSGLYGKIGTPSTEIVCHLSADGSDENDVWEWSIGPINPQTNQRRDDYRGLCSGTDFRSQRWFHVVGDRRAIAFAITALPDTCHRLTVRLSAEGLVSITAETQGNDGSLEFGLCAHFLNDIPAIAAATNPQSILLPPSAEAQMGC
jgi:hypothetical protein